MAKRTFRWLKKKPKSKKEWQEWQREYSIAFLSDQLDRVIPSATKKNYIVSLFNNWERRFRMECAKERPGETLGNAYDLVEDQIDFVTQYIACAILDGNSKENLDRIKHFISMQRAHNIEEKMELRFLGGSPIEAYAYVDSLNDIDISDVFFITNFDSMIACREKMKTWTKKAAKSFLNALKEDLLFDMPSSVIMSSPDEASGITRFEIPIRIDENDLNLQMFRCMPPAFLKRLK